MKAIVSSSVGLGCTILVVVALAAFGCGDVFDQPTGESEEMLALAQSGDWDDDGDNDSDDQGDNDDQGDDDQVRNPCDPNPCDPSNHEVCLALTPDTYHCVCDSGYSFDWQGQCVPLPPEPNFAHTPCQSDPCEEVWLFRGTCSIEPPAPSGLEERGRIQCLCNPGYIDPVDRPVYIDPDDGRAYIDLVDGPFYIEPSAGECGNPCTGYECGRKRVCEVIWSGPICVRSR